MTAGEPKNAPASGLRQHIHSTKRSSDEPTRADVIDRRRPVAGNARRNVLLLDGETVAPLDRLATPFEARRQDWTTLVETARIAAPSTVVVIDPFTGRDSQQLDDRIPVLLKAARMLPVIALVPLQSTFIPSIRTLQKWGVTDIADTDLEGTAAAIRMRLLSVHAQPLKKLVEESLSRFVSVDALSLLRAGVEVVVDRGTAVELGHLLGAKERTVAGWCAREGLPPPRRLLAWLRLLLAVSLLEDPDRRISNAAACAGYTDYSLRRALRELLGERAPTRERSLADGLSAFNCELRELREKARRARRRKYQLSRSEEDV